MPNANTFGRLVGAASPAQGSLAIPQVAPTVTSAFVPTNQLGNAAVLAVNSSGPAAPTTGGVGVDGYGFKLRLIGKATTTQSVNITAAIQLALSPSTTVSSNFTLATTGALALNTASGNFNLVAECLWDSVSTKISGFQTGTGVDQSLITLAALTNTSNHLTASGLSSLQFVPVLTASATAGTVISIDEFSIEAV